MTGATFPGKANAHINFKFLFFAAFLSIPPGFDAKSTNKQSSFTYLILSSVSIKCGTVLIITSYSDKFSPIVLMLVPMCPYALIHAKSSSFLAAHVTFAASPANFLASTFPILPNPNISTLLPCIILLVFAIIISIAPSAVDIVFKTANSSLFIISIISIYSSLAKS